MKNENLRPPGRRALGAGRCLGLSAALTVMALGALASAATATVLAGRPGPGALLGTPAVAAPVVPGGREPLGRRGAGSDAVGVRSGTGAGGELNVGMMATAVGFAFALVLLLACRPCLSRRRALHRFRAELRNCDDVASLWRQPTTPRSLPSADS